MLGLECRDAACARSSHSLAPQFVCDIASREYARDRGGSPPGWGHYVAVIIELEQSFEKAGCWIMPDRKEQASSLDAPVRSIDG